MDLSTNYLGMKLRSPLVASASPISEKIDNIKRMEDAGAGAVVLYSLFEEQIRQEQLQQFKHEEEHANHFAEALSYFPDPAEYRMGPERYLDQIRKAKDAVDIPIIASLNGTTVGGWNDYAKQMADAGADAIELNIYYIPTDFEKSGSDIENEYIEILKAVKNATGKPVALKISPFFSNMANMAKKLDDAGANALVLFNRFYQPDINLETAEVEPNIQLSHSSAIRLPMRWIAILRNNIKADLAATSGIHRGEDVVKLLMVGANVTMLCSALLKNGINEMKNIEIQMTDWMEENEYDSVETLRGRMTKEKVLNPEAFERSQYIKSLSDYKF